MRNIGTFGSVGVMFLLASACADSFSGDSGNNGSVAPPPCEASASPKSVSCVVDERYGVFVSGAASADGADGTKAHPFASIQAGIDAAHAASKNVYACIGEYSEQVKLADGTSVYGFFDCSQSWKVSETGHAIVTGASPALTADRIVTPTRVEAVDFKSTDAGPNQTSVGALITGSTALTLANLTIQSGAGGKGDDGTQAVALTQPKADGTAGFAGDTACTRSTMVVLGQCFPTPVLGGDGTCLGPGGYVGGAGGQGSTGAGCYACSGAGCCTQVGNTDHERDLGAPQPGTVTTATGATDGNPAVVGAAGEDGASGANAPAPGTLDPNGVFTPANGTTGTDGKPGQGGGGGEGVGITAFGTGPFRAGGGSGGGAGGCPGLAGGAGKGGGASIGIMLVDSPITIDTCILQSSAGGAGGAGDIGSAPTAGGNPGASSSPSLPNVSGAHGGPGGESGWSGNGYPGPSYAVATHGAAPTFTNCTETPGAGGAAIAAKTAGNKTIPATPAGPAEATHAF